jgi:hypothetical protein
MRTIFFYRKYIFFCVFLIPPIELEAQQIKRSSINSFGTNSVSNGGIKVTQSVGQSALTNSVKTGNTYYRSGFQQNGLMQKDQNELLLEMYPNPSNGTFSIALNSQEAIEVSIIDQQGKIVGFEKRSGNIIHEFDFQFLAAGMYQLNVKSVGKSTASKLVIYK